MEIEITQSDIDNGKRSVCQYCPLALALIRHIKPEVTVMVRPNWVELSLKGKYPHEHFDLPITAKLFIEWFDRGVRVFPTNLTLEVPPSIIEKYFLEGGAA